MLRTLNDCVRTMLLHSAAPLVFWAEALSTATYLINRRPCRATGTTTPFALLFGVEPTYDELRVFGCHCFPNLTASSHHKLDARSTLYVFIGYPADHRGYRCYDVATRHVMTSRHVVFDEQVFPFRKSSASSAPRQEPSYDVDDHGPRRRAAATPSASPTSSPPLTAALPHHRTRARTVRQGHHPPPSNVGAVT